MVDRTRIPTSMYPSGYTPSTPDGEVTPAAMTKDGSGEPFNKEMLQDYPCGSEPGHSFRSSPLNIYAIGNSSGLVLYVEGGCPNFTWVSDNAWADFGTAETSVRYNTLESGAGPGQDTVVTVTDTNGLEVTINVPWSGACGCCDDVSIEFAKQTPWSEIESINWPGEVVVFIDGGCSPFTWTISGANFTLGIASSNARRNWLLGASGADSDNIYMVVEDYCGSKLCWPGVLFNAQPCSFRFEGESQTITVSRGVAPIDWEFVGAATGWTIAEAQTADLDNIITAVENPTTKSVTLKGTDANGCTGTKTLYSGDILEYATSMGRHGSVVTVDTGLVFLCCEGPSNHGNAFTFSVDSDMQIAQLDTLDYSDYGAYSTVCKAHNGVYCVSNQLSGTGARLEAFLVDGSGNITQHENNSCDWMPGVALSIFNIEASYIESGVVVAVTNAGNGYAYAASIGVASSGEVTPTRLDVLQLTTGWGRQPYFTMISNTIGICVYTNVSYYLYARMFSVAADGTIALVGDETQVTDFAVYNPKVKKITDNWVIVAGRAALDKGYTWALQVSGTEIVLNTGYEHNFDDVGYVGSLAMTILSSSTFLILTPEGSAGTYGGHYWRFAVSLGSSISWTDVYHYDYGDNPMRFHDATLPRSGVLLESYFDSVDDGWLRTRRIC